MLIGSLKTVFIAGAAFTHVALTDAPMLYVSHYVGIEEGVQIGIANVNNDLRRSAIAFTCRALKAQSEKKISSRVRQFIHVALSGDARTKYQAALETQIPTAVAEAAKRCQVKLKP